MIIARDSRESRFLRVLTGVAAAGTLITLGISLAPDLPFAFRSPEFHILLEATAGFAAGLAAYLMFGRFRVSKLAGDLALVCALATFAVANLLFAALPTALAEGTPVTFSTWAALTARLLGAAVFAAAAFAPERRLTGERRHLAFLVAGNALALLLIAAFVALVQSHLPLGIDPSLSPDARGQPRLQEHPGLQLAQLAAGVLLAFAAGGFLRRRERTGDELAGWLAVAAVFGSFASLHYALFPSLYSEWVYTGDLFRLGFYVVVLGGAAREIGGYWQAVATATALEERRRIARDLHDGLAQELAFISVQSKRLLARGDDMAELEHLAVAAERALDESRRAIATLTRPLDEPLAEILAEVAEEVAGRAGIRLDFDLEDDIRVSPAAREALVRIVREAVTNAARHGRAKRARITLSNGHGVRLLISDDGVGLGEEASRRAGGYGLTSMEERARELGGALRVSSRPDSGTEIEVVLP